MSSSDSPASKMHMNHVGMVYAGSYFVFVEATGASLIKCTYGSTYVPIIKNMSLDYKKPCTGDLVVDISMTEKKNGGGARIPSTRCPPFFEEAKQRGPSPTTAHVLCLSAAPAISPHI